MSAPTVLLATAAEVWRVDTDAGATLEALHAEGVQARPAVWDDPAEDWGAADLVVVRSTWDYVPRRAEFVSWADRVGSVVDLANPAAVIRWNTDKSYLDDLAADGVPVVSTGYLRARAHTADPAATGPRVRAALDVDRDRDQDVVVKPTVSAGSKDTVRHGPDELDRAAAHAEALLAAGRDVMVQPYLGSVDTDGETGMLAFGGVHSHAFRKGPLLEPGGAPVSGLYAEEDIAARVATEEERSVAAAALAAVGRRFPGAGPLLYARVDVVRDRDGAPRLLELELTEPSFFLDTDPGAAARFARAVRARLERPR